MGEPAVPARDYPTGKRAGFSRIPAFGEYVLSPLSVCMAKDLGM